LIPILHVELFTKKVPLASPAEGYALARQPPRGRIIINISLHKRSIKY